MRGRLMGAVCGAVAALAAQPAAAHPHAWIELGSTVVFDAEGRLAALRIAWTFDEVYTAFAVGTLKKGDDAAFQKSLEGLARRNLDSLDEYNYFVDLRVGGAPRRLAPVREYRTGLAAGRLWMEFTAPLAEPQDPRAGAVAYAVYDPTYYIEILYPNGARVAVEGPHGGCRARIVPPEGNAEARRFAEALGPNESVDAGVGAAFSGRPGATLGELFAERAVIECR